MCGVLGQINRILPIDETEFIRMRDMMLHRGPDGFGHVFRQEYRMGLAHRRLSIIDLSPDAAQPMCNEDQTVWITFNGEIYNYLSLRSELINAGHHFRSKSDTEVLVHGYEQWGIAGLVLRLKGMFAFGIWDDRSEKLFLARDRFGIKPIVYGLIDDSFYFASELKAIKEASNVSLTINNHALADYFTYGYVPCPLTIWQGVYKLPPGHYLEFNNLDWSYELHRYWELKPGYSKISDNEALIRSQELIRQSLSEHLVSDVPLGLFLSGGYDSGTLLMYLSELNEQVQSYTVSFPGTDDDEVVEARALAETFNSPHLVEEISGSVDAFQLLNEMAPFYDEPFACSSMINVYQISKVASKFGKVVLSGEGADELFAGYKWHRKIDAYYKGWNIKRLIKEWLNGNFSSKNAFFHLYNRSMTGVLNEALSGYFLSDDLKDNIKSRGLYYFEQFYLKNQNPVKLCQYIDSLTFIPDHCLFRADMSSMAHSLEIRLPFLDHELYEYVFNLDPSVYFKAGRKKFLLEEAMKQRVPSSVLNMPKRGFSFIDPERIFDHRFLDLLHNGNLIKSEILKANQPLNELSSQAKLQLLNLELWWTHHAW
jgi:asparagine synthase (glutamine-hydrolysing)